MKNRVYKVITIICIELLVSSIHIFRLGTVFNGHMYNLYYSYFSDLVLPFGIYILLCASEVTNPFLKHWRVKAVIVFSLASIAEILQYFGVPALGITFDPLDFVMYGTGVLLAVIADIKIFPVVFNFWNTDQKEV